MGEIFRVTSIYVKTEQVATNSVLSGASFGRKVFRFTATTGGSANHSPHTFPLILRKGSSIFPSVNKKI